MKIARLVVAKHDESRKCFAKDGEWLVAARPDSKAPIRLGTVDHFFVGVDTGAVSLYGWVEEPDQALSLDEIVNAVLGSPARDLVGLTEEGVREQAELTLRSVKNLSPGTPVVTDFSKKSFNDKTLVQKVHRVFLKGR